MPARAVLAAALLLSIPLPAVADSFFFGFSTGGHHRYRHHHHHHHHRPYWDPYWRHHHYYGPRVTYYSPPVYYPPPVVYAPPPAVYAQPLVAVPTSPVYRAGNGQYCREYQSTVAVGGAAQPGYGTACLQPDGAWRIVN